MREESDGRTAGKEIRWRGIAGFSLGNARSPAYPLPARMPWGYVRLSNNLLSGNVRVIEIRPFMSANQVLSRFHLDLDLSARYRQRAGALLQRRHPLLEHRHGRVGDEL